MSVWSVRVLRLSLVEFRVDDNLIFTLIPNQIHDFFYAVGQRISTLLYAGLAS